jgi:hypothetical protein
MTPVLYFVNFGNAQSGDRGLMAFDKNQADIFAFETGGRIREISQWDEIKFVIGTYLTPQQTEVLYRDRYVYFYGPFDVVV